MEGDDWLILDEAQSWPELFPRLRGAIDADRSRKNRFLLLGSVAPSLTTRVSESLAGRVSRSHLDPLGLLEVPGGDLDRLWWRRVEVSLRFPYTRPCCGGVSEKKDGPPTSAIPSGAASRPTTATGSPMSEFPFHLSMFMPANPGSFIPPFLAACPVRSQAQNPERRPGRRG